MDGQQGGELAPTTQPDLPAAVRSGLPAVIDVRKARNFWPKFWRNVGRIPFSEELVSAWYCWADPKTPMRVKAVLGGALAYFVVPTDMIPDFVAGLGFTDDATVLATALGVAGAYVKRRHRTAARMLLQKPPS